MKEVYVVYDLQEEGYQPHLFSEEEDDITSIFANHLRSVIGGGFDDDTEVIEVMGYEIKKVPTHYHEELLNVFYS